VRHASKLAEFGNGEQPIFLLTRPVDGSCPWVRPKLTDLYTVSFERLPDDADGNLTMMSVADDGTVTALDSTSSGKSLLRRKLGDVAWDVVATGLQATDGFFTAPAGDSILLTLRDGTVDAGYTYTPTLRDEAGVNSQLSGLLFDSSIIEGASLDLTKVVGRGRMGGESGETPWIWDRAEGQRALPVNGEVSHAIPMVVANDGVVLGLGGSPSIPNTGMFNVPFYFAMRWDSSGVTEVLRDLEGRVFANPAACGLTCETIIGNARLDASGFGVTNPPSAWYWKSNRDSALLTSFDADTEWAGYTYWAADVSGDGSFVTGSMYFDRHGGGQDKDALLWTQNTGAVGVTPLLAALGTTLPWDSFRATSISANGKFIVLQGRIPTGSGNATRAALLRLEPKAPDETR
jgi:hypothetical protein